MNEYSLLAWSAFQTFLTNARGRWSPHYHAPRRILVVKLDHLGDVVLATPALRALRRSQSAPIDILLASSSKPLIEPGVLVDEVFAYDSPRFRRVGVAGGSDSQERERLLAALLGRGYDWIVELRGDEWTTGALLRALRPSRRFDRGTTRAVEWLKRRWGRRRVGDPDDLHEVASNLRVIAGAVPHARAAVGSASVLNAPEVPPWRDARESLEAALRHQAPSFDLHRPYAVIQLGASWAPRAWGADRFGAIAGHIRAAYDAPIVVLGLAEDAVLRDAFVRGGGPTDAAFLFGTLSIPEVGALLRGARLFVGSDGGSAHIAAASGTPTLVMFGPQNPARFRPCGGAVTVLHHPVACYPCSQTVCVRPDLPCVQLISIEEAMTAVKTLWPPNASKPPLAPR